MKTRRVHTHLLPEDVEDLNRAAARAGVSRSEVIRDALARAGVVAPSIIRAGARGERRPLGLLESMEAGY